MPYYRLRLPREVYYFILGIGLIFLLIEWLGIMLLWVGLGALLIAIVAYLLWNFKRWKTIEELNQGLDISRKTVYIDRNGYFRWKSSEKLCHRKIAWENNLRGTNNFGDCDIHHKDKNKFNNQPSNLEVLTREQHQFKHQQIIMFDGQKYHRLAAISKIYRTTARAYLVANRCIPRSQVINRHGYIYIPEWLYKEDGFG